MLQLLSSGARFAVASALWLGASSLAPLRADAALLGLLEVPGIPGESIAPLPDQIDVLSYQLGLTPPSSGKAKGQGLEACGTKRASLLNEISVTKSIDKASPKLFVAAALGTIFPTVTLRIYQPDPLFNYLTVTLTNALVSSITNGGESSDSDRPSETVQFAYASIDISYAKPGGTPADTAQATWSVCER
jgi:type VI secretion system Hcp family effector